MIKKYTFSTIRSAFIQECYFYYLGRLADPTGFAELHSSEMSLAEIDSVFRNCQERKTILRLRDEIAARLGTRGRGKNVLLFGAFGNGNKGDAALPSLIARDLETRFGVGVFAYSELAVEDYDFPEIGKLHTEPGMSLGPLNPVVLSLFDGLLIGGGGMLAWPHSPLWDSNWAYLLSCPVAIFACGVANPLPHEVCNIVRLARVASGRDARSVSALASVNPNAMLCPDPILALVQAPKMTQEGRGRAFILRGPAREAHHQIRATLMPEDVVISVAIDIDYPLFHLFPEMRVVAELEDLFALIVDKELVVSERFHGAICALHAGIRAFGLTRDDHNAAKIQELFKSFGAEDFCSNTIVVPERAFPHQAAADAIATARVSYRAATDSILGELLQERIKQPRRPKAGLPRKRARSPA
jgi:hypothetical protein